MSHVQKEKQYLLGYEEESMVTELKPNCQGKSSCWHNSGCMSLSSLTP
jgi:hypothetical protein